MSFPQYQSYRDCGVEWLGEAPSHWPIQPLKTVATFVNGEAFKPSEWSEAGVPIIRIQNLNGGEEFNYYDGEVEQKYNVIPGDLLFGWSGNRGTSFGPFRWSREGIHYLNQHIFKVQSDSANTEWLYWCLKAVTEYVEQEAHGIIGMVHVTQGRLGAINVPFPSRTEQSSIAAFLNQETAKIDALVEEQQRLIELLKEKRQAVISHGVTKGLDPNAPMKDSGVEWLGEAPAHWRVCLLKRAFREIDYGISDSLDLEGAVAVLRMGNIQAGGITMGDLKYVVQVEPELLLQPLDLLFNRTNSLDQIGKVGMIVDLPDVPLTFASYLVRLRVEGNCLPAFMAFLLNSEGILGEARARAFVAIGQCNLNPTRYGEIVVALPPLNEQAEIAEFIGREAALLDQLQAEAESAIPLLQERRSALISAAVTGKIDVRAVVAPTAAEAEAA